MKYLMLFAFLGVVWWVWSKRRAQGEETPAKPSAPFPERMLTCAHCGVYFPESDGVVEAARAYCCEAHRVAAHSAEH